METRQAWIKMILDRQPAQVSTLRAMHNELLAGNELGRAIRAVNRTLLEEFNKIAPIAGTTMLDAAAQYKVSPLKRPLNWEWPPTRPQPCLMSTGKARSSSSKAMVALLAVSET